jgi:hypothetical protein
MRRASFDPRNKSEGMQALDDSGGRGEDGQPNGEIAAMPSFQRNDGA